jgi:hypothetical protein
MSYFQRMQSNQKDNMNRQSNGLQTLPWDFHTTVSHPETSNSSDSHVNVILPGSNVECRCQLIFERPVKSPNVKSIRRNQRNSLQEIREGKSIPNVMRR